MNTIWILTAAAGLTVGFLYVFRHPLAKRLHALGDWDEERAFLKAQHKEEKKEMRRRRKEARRG